MASSMPRIAMALRSAHTSPSQARSRANSIANTSHRTNGSSWNMTYLPLRENLASSACRLIQAPPTMQVTTTPISANQPLSQELCRIPNSASKLLNCLNFQPSKQSATQRLNRWSIRICAASRQAISCRSKTTSNQSMAAGCTATKRRMVSCNMSISRKAFRWKISR